MSETPGAPSPLKSILYWTHRTKFWWTCPPVVLALDAANTLSMKDIDGTVAFSAPLNQANIRITGWGTMLIGVDGKRYRITGMGASSSPRPSREQVAEVTEAQTRLKQPSQVLTTGGAVATATAGFDPALGALGGAAMTVAFYEGLGNIKAWQDVLVARGADIETSTMRNMTYYLVALAIAIVVGLVITLRHH